MRAIGGLMRRVFLVFVFISLALCVFAETVVLTPGENGARALSSTASEIVLEFQISSFERESVSINNQDYSLIRLPGEGISLDAGLPELPVLNRSVIIDDQAKMRAEIYDLQYQDIELRIAPSKGNLMRNQEPALVPWTFGAVYQEDEYYPRLQVELSEPYIYRDFRGITVKTNPFAYNPARGILRVYTSYKVRLVPDGQDTINTFNSTRGEILREFATAYEHHFLNWDSSRYTSLSETFGKILIICHSAYTDAAQPLVDWKLQKGIATEMVSTDVTGTATNYIWSYIASYYASNPTLMYVILIGDYSHISSMDYNGGAADPYYTLLTGSDNYPEIYVGRLSSQSATDVTTQVNKIITYERDLGTGATWLSKATGIASDQGPGDDNEYDYVHMNNIRTDLINYGYTTVDQIYDPDASAASVSTALNNGRGFVNYCGHGWEYGWSTTGFNTSNISGLNNGGMLPFIQSVACLNGNFASYTCFGEVWLRKSGGGAIGIYASSTNQSWSPPMSAQDETTDLLRLNTKITMGGIFLNGALKMIDDYGTSGIEMYRTWNIFGDPSLLYRSKTPQAMTVTHANVINYNTTSITVTTGVAYAYVGISSEGTIYGKGYAGAAGTATISLSGLPVTPRVLTVTVTAHNRVTYVGNLYLGHIWTGAATTNWSNLMNWNSGEVPDSGYDVLIPAGAPRYPSTYGAASYCRNITVENGASLTISSFNLNVAGAANFYGQLVMSSDSGNLYVTSTLTFSEGATANITASSAEIYCSNNLIFSTGSNVQFALGYLEFTGTGSGYLVNHSSSTQINHLRSNKDSSAFSGFAATSSQALTINGNIWNYEGSKFVSYYTGTVFLKGNLTDYNTDPAYGIMLYSGTLKLNGSSQSISLQGPGCFLKNLTLAQSGTVSLGYNLVVEGNVVIDSGTFNASSRTITVGGNWTNNYGHTAFTEGTSRVILNGAGDQAVSSENFNILELAKPSGNMLINTGSTVTCVTYDWTSGAYTVSGGTFTVADLNDPGIYGTITLSSGTINYTQDTVSYIDLRANLTITNGTFNVYGGNSSMYFSYGDSATLTMNGPGLFDVKNVGIYIPTSPVFNDNITNGTIRTTGSFSCQQAGFNPSGGILTMSGPNDATISMIAGSNLHKLRIDKGATRAEDGEDRNWEADRNGRRRELTRNNSVSATTNLDINDYFVLAAGSFTAPEEITIGGYWYNYVGPAGFIEGTNTVVFDGSGHQYCQQSEDFYNLTINKSGGALRLNDGSITVTCQSYTWIAGAVDVLSGTFTALDLSQAGIYGNFYNNAGGTINLYQDAQYPDLNGFLYNYGGTYNLYGGNTDCYVSYAADGGITQTGGIIDFHDKGLRIMPSSFACTINVTGGTIRTVGTFNISRENTVFAGGDVELYGTTLSPILGGTGSRIYNLRVNKQVATRSAESPDPVVTRGDPIPPPDDRVINAYLTGNFVVSNSLTITSGEFSPGAYTLDIYNDLLIYGKLTMTSAGTINCWDDVNWYNGSVGLVSNGTINAGWDWYFHPGCTVNMTGSTVNMVPDYDATIMCSSPNATFGNLTLDGNGGGEGSDFHIYDLSTDMLRVNGNLQINDENSLYLGEISANVNANLTSMAGSYISVGDGSSLTIYGSLTQLGNMSTGPGTIIVHDNYSPQDSCTLIINGGSFINDQAFVGVIALRGTIILQSGLLEITFNSVNIIANTDSQWTGGTFRCGAGFNATTAGNFLPTGGTLDMVSSVNPVLKVNNGNHLNHLRIYLGTSNIVYLNDAITIKGNVLLERGNLNTGNYGVTIHGTWNNLVGPGYLNEGTSTFTFAGNLDNTGFLSNETIYNLVINNSSTNWDNFEVAVGKTLTVLNDVLIQNGTLNLKTSANLLVTRDIIITAGAGLNCYAGAGIITSFGRDFVDNNTSTNTERGYSCGSSQLKATGSVASSITCSSPQFTVHNFEINKAFNVPVNLMDNLYISGSCNIVQGVWNSNVAGLSHTILSSLSIAGDGAINSTQADIISFAGASPSNLTVLGTVNNCSIYIAKNSPSLSVYLQSDCNLPGLNSLEVITGILNLNAHFLAVGSDVLVNNLGTLYIMIGSSLRMANGKTLAVQSGGTLDIRGTNTNPAILTHQSGYYTCTIYSGGTIRADHAIFEYMSGSGIYVTSGATVDPSYPFNYCTFRNGNGGSTLLKIHTSQNLVINNASFPANTWGGTYNVSKAIDAGTLQFTNASGEFAGAAYEQDPFNRISWAAPDPISNLQVFVDSVSGIVTLFWNYPTPGTEFRIYAADSPEGPFLMIGNTFSQSWGHIPGEGKKFYRVTANN